MSQKATLEALKIYAKRADVIEEFAFLKDCPIFERDSVLKRFVEEEKEPLCMICRVKKVGKGISITTASLIVFVDWVPEEADRIQAEKVSSVSIVVAFVVLISCVSAFIA